MKFITAQPCEPRFLWELEVLITNIRKTCLDKHEIIAIFNDQNPHLMREFQQKYGDQVMIKIYSDNRDNRAYPPTARPYLLWRFLSEDKARENDTYFQLDSDVIFREIPDIPELSGKKIIGSDCGGYIDYNYLITRKNGAQIVDGFAKILNVPEDLIRETPGIGAQWIFTNPTADLWWHIWRDSDNLYNFLQGIDSDIQKWTAEMWSQLYNFAKYGWEVEISPELAFCMSTDPVELWDSKKILHNAGVVSSNASACFYKGDYISRSPFGDDLSWVRRDKCSRKYVDAIEKVSIENTK